MDGLGESNVEPGAPRDPDGTGQNPAGKRDQAAIEAGIEKCDSLFALLMMLWPTSRGSPGITLAPAISLLRLSSITC